jgi:GNAT superfamily N-acetyltransferase
LSTEISSTAITICRVSIPEELEGIKALQTRNLKSVLDPEEISGQGFVTASYSPALLQQMHEAEPSVIAKAGDQVVGYALASTRSIYGSHPLLDDLFDQADRHMYRGRLLKESNYIIMGQICVDKSYRGKGLVQAMYARFREEMSGSYEYCICDIDRGNPRSLKAHLKTGFRIIGSLSFGGSIWDLVLWDWHG